MKKQTTKKEVVEVTVANAFPLVSTFTIKATIPTGQYANIQPEITVNDITFEEIDTIIMPKIESMFMHYHNFNEKITEKLKQAQTENNQSILESQAFVLAKNALTAAKSPEAKLAVQQQISMSKKLTKYEIEKLLAM